MSGLRRIANAPVVARARQLMPRASGRAGTDLPRMGPKVDPPAVSSVEIERRRHDAARLFAEQQWDLGGLAYEMAVRDHFRLDVLQLRAARLQELDAELSQLERLARFEDAGAAGSCPGCGSLYGRGAAFCSSCGSQLIDTVTPG